MPYIPSTETMAEVPAAYTPADDVRPDPKINGVWIAICFQNHFEHWSLWNSLIGKMILKGVTHVELVFKVETPENTFYSLSATRGTPIELCPRTFDGPTHAPTRYEGETKPPCRYGFRFLEASAEEIEALWNFSLAQRDKVFSTRKIWWMFASNASYGWVPAVQTSETEAWSWHAAELVFAALQRAGIFAADRERSEALTEQQVRAIEDASTKNPGGMGYAELYELLLPMTRLYHQSIVRLKGKRRYMRLRLVDQPWELNESEDDTIHVREL